LIDTITQYQSLLIGEFTQNEATIARLSVAQTPVKKVQPPPHGKSQVSPNPKSSPLNYNLVGDTSVLVKQRERVSDDLLELLDLSLEQCKTLLSFSNSAASHLPFPCLEHLLVNPTVLAAVLSYKNDIPNHIKFRAVGVIFLALERLKNLSLLSNTGTPTNSCASNPFDAEFDDSIFESMDLDAVAPPPPPEIDEKKRAEEERNTKAISGQCEELAKNLGGEIFAAVVGLYWAKFQKKRTNSKRDPMNMNTLDLAIRATAFMVPLFARFKVNEVLWLPSLC
jgi:hypothetical protein